MGKLGLLVNGGGGQHEGRRGERLCKAKDSYGQSCLPGSTTLTIDAESVHSPIKEEAHFHRSSKPFPSPRQTPNPTLKPSFPMFPMHSTQVSLCSS